MTEPTTFPKTLYVEIRDAEGTPCFCAAEDLSECAEVDTKIRVGVYQLIGLQDVEFQVVSTRVEAS